MYLKRCSLICVCPLRSPLSGSVCVIKMDTLSIHDSHILALPIWRYFSPHSIVQSIAELERRYYVYRFTPTRVPKLRFKVGISSKSGWTTTCEYSNSKSVIWNISFNARLVHLSFPSTPSVCLLMPYRISRSECTLGLPVSWCTLHLRPQKNKDRECLAYF